MVCSCPFMDAVNTSLPWESIILNSELITFSEEMVNELLVGLGNKFNL